MNMSEDSRCCGSGTCIINEEGLCWCGQRWVGDRLCQDTAKETAPQGDEHHAKTAEDGDL